MLTRPTRLSLEYLALVFVLVALAAWMAGCAFQSTSTGITDPSPLVQALLAPAELPTSPAAPGTAVPSAPTPPLPPVPNVPPEACQNPRNTLLAQMWPTGMGIDLRNDTNCQVTVILVGSDVTNYRHPNQGQVLRQIAELTLPAHGVGGVQTLSLNGLSACYQTDFWYQLTAADVGTPQGTQQYPPYRSHLELQHGPPPVGCDLID